MQPLVYKVQRDSSILVTAQWAFFDSVLKFPLHLSLVSVYRPTTSRASEDPAKSHQHSERYPATGQVRPPTI